MSKRPASPDPRRLQGIPRVNWVQPSGDTDDAADAIFFASEYGLVPDLWQEAIIHSWLGRGRDCKWTHPRNGLAVPRQNGKNGALEVRELYGLVVLDEAILHTAHQIKTSRKAFKRLKHFFGEKADDPDAKFPELNALVLEVRNTNGQEAIALKDVWLVDGVEVRSAGRPADGYDVRLLRRGGFIEFATRTQRGGRGTTYDLLVVDEAQHLSEEDLEAIRPVISSARLGNAQVIYLGTPPDPDKLSAGVGEAWTRIRKGAGKSKDLGWIEYGAPDGPLPDLDDQALLFSSNPSLEVRHGNGDFGLSLKVVNGERDELSPAGYARERLGWWGNPEAKSHRGVIDMDQWRTLKVAGNELPSRGTIVIDCHPDLLWTTVAIATDGPDGRPLGLVDRNEGTAWVPKRIQQLVEDLDQVVEIPTGKEDRDGTPKTTAGVALTPSAKHFDSALTKLGIPYHVLTPGEVGDGCVGLQQMITDNEVAHVGQPTLDISARNAVTRYVGDVQQWDRRQNRKTDISPLVAYSVAVVRFRAAAAVQPKVVAPPRRAQRSTAAATVSRTRRQPRRPTTGFDPRSSGF